MLLSHLLKLGADGQPEECVRDLQGGLGDEHIVPVCKYQEKLTYRDVSIHLTTCPKG